MMKKLDSEKLLAGASERFVEEIIQREAKEKELVSNYDYISWLEKFTLMHEGFANDSWLYKPTEISEEDNSNVEKLYSFFYGIASYCYKFYINIDCHEDFERERLHIKHNNIGYQIGLVVGQGSYVYVNREEPKDDAIDFCNVVNDIKPEDFESKKSFVERLESLILAARNAGVPLNEISNIITKYYN